MPAAVCGSGNCPKSQSKVPAIGYDEMLMHENWQKDVWALASSIVSPTRVFYRQHCKLRKHSD